jgi:cell fate regulator YaaT (PSP1 superfamily)
MGVILETSWGIEFGECVRGNSEVPDEKLVAPLRPILRLATPEDYEIVRKNREKETDAFAICQKKIQEHELDMKLVDVEYSFEGNKILFFFTSEGRVDFRALVKDLASIFHNRIELRQIGVRDEAKMLGGLGICGRPFCCASFLREFQPVSIKMAKTQSLSLNPTKISGTCGRLMCCLKYEQDAYEDLLKTSPKADSFVETPDGVGDIISVNTLREKVRVRLDSAPDTLKIYHNSEIRVVRAGKGKRPEDYRPPSPEELEKLRLVQEAVVAEVNSSENSGLRSMFGDPVVETPKVEQTPKGDRSKKEEKKQGGKNSARSHSHHHQGMRKDRKTEKEPKTEGHPLTNSKKDTEHVPYRADQGGKQQNRRHKAASQSPIEKGLPREKNSTQKDSEGEKKNYRPYWRRKSSQRNKKPKEGGTE